MTMGSSMCSSSRCNCQYHNSCNFAHVFSIGKLFRHKRGGKSVCACECAVLVNDSLSLSSSTNVSGKSDPGSVQQQHQKQYLTHSLCRCITTYHTMIHGTLEWFCVSWWGSSKHSVSLSVNQSS
jgi:hypothetical protein